MLVQRHQTFKFIRNLEFDHWNRYLINPLRCLMPILITLEIVRPQQPNTRKIYYKTNDIRETSCNRIKHVLIWKLIINSYLFRQHFIRFFDRATCHQSILILSALKLHKRRRNIHTYICMNTVILMKLAIMKNLVFEQKKENKLYFIQKGIIFTTFWKERIDLKYW